MTENIKPRQLAVGGFYKNPEDCPHYLRAYDPTSSYNYVPGEPAPKKKPKKAEG